MHTHTHRSHTTYSFRVTFGKTIRKAHVTFSNSCQDSRQRLNFKPVDWIWFPGSFDAMASCRPSLDLTRAELGLPALKRQFPHLEVGYCGVESWTMLEISSQLKVWPHQVCFGWRQIYRFPFCYSIEPRWMCWLPSLMMLRELGLAMNLLWLWWTDLVHVEGRLWLDLPWFKWRILSYTGMSIEDEKT